MQNADDALKLDFHISTTLSCCKWVQSDLAGMMTDDSPDFMDSVINLCMSASSPEDARCSNIRLTFSSIRLLLLPSQAGTQQSQSFACKQTQKSSNLHAKTRQHDSALLILGANAAVH